MASVVYELVAGGFTGTFTLPATVTSASISVVSVIASNITSTSSAALSSSTPALSGKTFALHMKEGHGLCSPEAETILAWIKLGVDCVAVVCVCFGAVEHKWKGAPAPFNYFSIRIAFFGAMLSAVGTLLFGGQKLYCGKPDSRLHAADYWIVAVIAVVGAVLAMDKFVEKASKAAEARRKKERGEEVVVADEAEVGTTTAGRSTSAEHRPRV